MNKRLEQVLAADHTLIMGILNITEDSFSDGGQFSDAEAAIAHASEMLTRGADIVDIGAESTRPGAERVDAQVEQDRVLSALDGLLSLHPDALISIDTTRTSVAKAALAHGAAIINDVSGGRLDPTLPRLVAESDCLYVMQHWRGWLVRNATTTFYPNGVVNDVYTELMVQVDEALEAGVDPDQIIIDPGLGFSKPGEELNFPLMTGVEKFTDTGFPVLMGASRKRFIASALEVEKGESEPSMHRRDTATAVLSALLSLEGVWGVRVHNVGATKDALAMATQWKRFEGKAE